MTPLKIPPALAAIATTKLNLRLDDFADADELAHEAHFQIDHLIRAHALSHGDRRTIELLDLHEAVEASFEEAPRYDC